MSLFISHSFSGFGPLGIGIQCVGFGSFRSQFPSSSMYSMLYGIMVSAHVKTSSFFGADSIGSHSSGTRALASIWATTLRAARIYALSSSFHPSLEYGHGLSEAIA